MMTTISIKTLPLLQEALQNDERICSDSRGNIALSGAYAIPFQDLFYTSERENKFKQQVMDFVDLHEGASIKKQRKIHQFFKIFHKRHPSTQGSLTLVALEARISRCRNDVLRVPRETELFNWVKVAMEWFSLQEGVDLQEMSCNQVDELLRPLSVSSWKKLLQIKEIRVRFFNAVLRYRCPAALFFIFPGLFLQLEKPYILDLFGIEPGLLTIDFSDSDKSPFHVVALLYNGREIDLLDRNKSIAVSFTQAWSIDAIFKEVALRDFQVSSWQMVPGRGLLFWSPKKVAQVIDLQKKDYWKSLPYFSLLPEQYAVRYKVHLKQGEAQLSLVAVRRAPKIELANNHAYLEIVIRERRGYRVYPFGFFPTNYSQDVVDTIETLFAPIQGSWLYPDQNFTTREREHCRFSKKMSPTELELAWKLFRIQLIKSDEGKLAFQLAVMNCATMARIFFNAVFSNKIIPREWFVITFDDIETPPLVFGLLNKIMPLSRIFFDGLKRKSALPISSHPYFQDRWISAPILEHKGLFSASKFFSHDSVSSTLCNF